MKEHLKRLTSESAYYGISTVGARMLNFLLVPFYTQVLATNDYGIVSIVYAYLAFLNIVFTFGLEPAFMRFYPDRADAERPDLFSTPFLAIVGISVISATLIHLFQSQIAEAALVPFQWKHIIALGAWTIVIDAANVIPFATLRMQNRPRRFALIRFSSILVNIALNIYLIVGRNMGIDAIFLSGIIASGLSTVLLLPTTLKLLRPRFSFATLRPLLSYGLPAIPALLASVIVSTVDKPMISWLMDASAVGVYQANYKLGIFMMLIVGMFQFAWQPFYLQMKDESNAKEIFARVMTYFILVALTVALALSFYIDDIVQISVFGRNIIRSNYWPGLGIVPIILFSYVWTGVYYISNAGIFIKNKTKHLPWITGAGAVTNVAINYFLIPVYGMFGAAYATLAAYVVMALLSYIITQRFYPISYEGARIFKIVGAAAIPATLWYSGLVASLLPEFLGETILLLLYFLLLFAFRFLSPGELSELRSLAVRLLSPSKSR